MEINCSLLSLIFTSLNFVLLGIKPVTGARTLRQRNKINERLRITNVIHHPCWHSSLDANDNALKSIPPGIKVAMLNSDATAPLIPIRKYPGCYYLNSTLVVVGDQPVSSNLQVYVELRFALTEAAMQNAPERCRGYDEKTGCGGFGSCTPQTPSVYCDRCEELAEKVERRENRVMFELHRDDAAMKCGDKLRPGTHDNVRLQFCMPSDRQFLEMLRDQGISSSVAKDWLEKKGATLYAGAVHMNIYMYDGNVANAITSQRNIERVLTRNYTESLPMRAYVNMPFTKYIYRQLMLQEEEADKSRMVGNFKYIGCHKFSGTLLVNIDKDDERFLDARRDSERDKGQEHVIVVGGGLAGLSAAVEAAQAGANVTLLDKEAKLGGNSAKATSGINGAGTPVQKTRGIKDGPDLLFADTMAAGDNQNDPELVDALAHESASSVAWLTDLGINLDDVNLCGGHSVARTHWLPPLSEGRPINVGMAIINGVKAKLESLAKEAPSTQKIEIVGNAKAKGLIYNADSKHVSGVKAVLPTYPDTEVEITGRVVLASGGYSSAESLLNEFNSDKEAAMLPTTNGAFANGDGVEMARAIGAQLVDMQHVQIHPTAFIDPASPDAKTKFLAAEALRGKGAILLNEQGERFANELDRRDVLTAKIMKHCALNHEAGGVHTAWMLLPDGAVDAFGRATFAFYAKVKKFFHSFNSIEELAKFTSMDLETLKITIADYNTYVSGAEKDPFGKTVFPARYPDDSFPWHVARITPAVHYTMGGVKIDEQGRVIGADDIPIPGLYAAGEVTGGVHGTNRLGGMWVIFGIIFVGMFAAALGYFPFSLHFY